MRVYCGLYHAPAAGAADNETSAGDCSGSTAGWRARGFSGAQIDPAARNLRNTEFRKKGRRDGAVAVRQFRVQGVLFPLSLRPNTPGQACGDPAAWRREGRRPDLPRLPATEIAATDFMIPAIYRGLRVVFIG